MRKCIGIISYFPNDLKVRDERIKRFKKLLSVLDKYFKLPIAIVAQNWKDFVLPPYCNTIYLYKYSSGLGVTGARIALRDKLLKLNFDYFIFLDDDSDIKCTNKGVENYFKEIDSNPDKFGNFNGCWQRLNAISKTMLKIMDYDYIKDYESFRGEIWEDFAYNKTYKALFPQKVFQFSKWEISENSQMARNDEYTTWYRPEFGNENKIKLNTIKIANNWISEKRKKKYESVFRNNKLSAGWY